MEIIVCGTDNLSEMFAQSRNEMFEVATVWYEHATVLDIQSSD